MTWGTERGSNRFTAGPGLDPEWGTLKDGECPDVCANLTQKPWMLSESHHSQHPAPGSAAPHPTCSLSRDSLKNSHLPGVVARPGSVPRRPTAGIWGRPPAASLKHSEENPSSREGRLPPLPFCPQASSESWGGWGRVGTRRTAGCDIKSSDKSIRKG